MEAVSNFDLFSLILCLEFAGIALRHLPPKACRLWSCVFVLCFVCFPSLRPCGRSDGCLFAERGWVISIARLRTLPPVYLRPIDVIVFDGPYVEILS